MKVKQIIQNCLHGRSVSCFYTLTILFYNTDQTLLYKLSVRYDWQPANYWAVKGVTVSVTRVTVTVTTATGLCRRGFGFFRSKEHTTQQTEVSKYAPFLCHMPVRFHGYNNRPSLRLDTISESVLLALGQLNHRAKTIQMLCTRQSH